MEKTIVTVLNGHNSPETAYVVDDYPSGGLRCKARYWIEQAPNKGSHPLQYRMGRQTTNPRKAGEHWCKTKYSTYSFFAFLYLDEDGHVQQYCFSQYFQPKDLEPIWAVRDQFDSKTRQELEALEAAHRKTFPDAWAAYEQQNVTKT